MKFLFLVLPAGVLLAGAFLYFVGSTPAASEALTPEPSRPVGAATGTEAGFDADALVTRFEALSAEVERLTMEVTALRSELSRKPVAVEEKLSEAVTAAAPVDRDTIVQVLEEEREREQEERRAEREQKDLDKLLDRAERVSRELGLGPDGEKHLGDVLIAERQKRADFITSVKERGRSKEAGALVREGLRGIDAWRTQELGKHFGLDVAEQVEGLVDKNLDKKARFRESDSKKDRRKNTDS